MVWYTALNYMTWSLIIWWDYVTGVHTSDDFKWYLGQISFWIESQKGASLVILTKRNAEDKVIIIDVQL